ncbi:hypothetical protein ABK040_006317 [Willaertia magna]
MKLNPLVGLPQGLAFGLLLEKSKMAYPDNIVKQMQLKDWTMMKVFLTAAGTSCLTMSALNLLGLSTMNVLPLHTKGNVIGGLLLGIGMTVSGSCPGTVLAQLGTGTIPSAKYSLLGGILGAATFGMLNNTSFIKNYLDSPEIPNSTLDGLLGTKFHLVALPLGAAMIGIAAFLEKLFPSGCKTKVSLKDKQWHPIISGVGIGLLQLPVQLLMGVNIGTSSAYVTCARTVTQYLPVEQSYFSKFAISTPKMIWQCIQDVSMVVGAYLSTKLSASKDNSAVAEKTVVKEPCTKQKIASFVGGFLLLFGARLAGGCTSGHGLSGMANMSVSSMLTVMSMLAGAIGVGLLSEKLMVKRCN